MDLTSHKLLADARLTCATHAGAPDDAGGILSEFAASATLMQHVAAQLWPQSSCLLELPPFTDSTATANIAAAAWESEQLEQLSLQRGIGLFRGRWGASSLPTQFAAVLLLEGQDAPLRQREVRVTPKQLRAAVF